MSGDARAKLSQRQQQVCDLIAQGKRNKEIAKEIGISTRTVEAHRGSIYLKIGVRNAAELVSRIAQGTNSI
jgi:DNA-binding NarL/FixJ family response regulator